MAARTLLEVVGAVGARAPKAREDNETGSLDPDMLSLEDIDREILKLR